MSPPEDDFEDELEIALANDVAPWVMTPQWILLAASGNAVKLYGLLLGHVNQGRGDHTAYPLVKDLCLWMGFSPKQSRSVKKYADELVELGAVKVIQRYDVRGMRTRNKYILHHNPPAGFKGDRSIPEFYRRRKKEEETAAQQVVRSSAPRSNQGKPDDSSVSAGRPVVRSSAVRGAPQRTSVVRSSAPQLEELRTRRTNPPPVSSAETPSAKAKGGGGRDSSKKNDNDVDALVDEVVALRPDWRREKVHAALQMPGVLERPRHLWRPALLAVAADPSTQYPGRLAHDGPWWSATIPRQARRTTDLAPAEVVELAARREEAQRTVDASSHAAALRAQLKSAKQ